MVEYAKLIPDIGNQQYGEFTRERLIYGQKVVSDRIKLNRFVLPTTKINEDENDRKVLKSETFNKLRITCELRPNLCKQAFTKEFTHLPESLTKNGEMYHSTKSQALKIFDAVNPSLSSNVQEDPDVIIMDFSALINAQAAITNVKIFGEFSQEIISTIRKSKARLRIDIVCDSYHKQSLKSQTRSVRGDGQELAFDTNTPLPIDICNTFLRNNENKKNLNQFLTNEILMHISDRIICITVNQNVWTNNEADTKLIIHIWNSLKSGYQYIQITTSDTDVVVIVISKIQCNDNSDIWSWTE